MPSAVGPDADPGWRVRSRRAHRVSYALEDCTRGACAGVVLALSFVGMVVLWVPTAAA